MNIIANFFRVFCTRQEHFLSPMQNRGAFMYKWKNSTANRFVEDSQISVANASAFCFDVLPGILVFWVVFCG